MPLRLRFEEGGRVLEVLVLDELLHELAARVFLGLGRRLGVRQQHLALDLHQRGRRHQEVAGAFHVDQREDVEVLLELLGHARHLDVADVHLLALDEEQQQVQRAAEGVEDDLVFGGCGGGHGGGYTCRDAMRPARFKRVRDSHGAWTTFGEQTTQGPSRSSTPWRFSSGRIPAK